MLGTIIPGPIMQKQISESMAAVQLAKRELRRKIQSILRDVPQESVNLQCSKTFPFATQSSVYVKKAKV